LQQTAGIIGVVVSGTFLLLLGVINLVVLRQVVGVFTRMRSGAYDEAELEKHLNSRGLINRVLGPVTRAIRRPGQMYPVGLLFGLGFDTATEVSLLVLASGAAAFNAPSFAILTLPVLFAAGMCLLDTLDGILMNSAYGWAFSTPVRKVYYNLTITGLSVAIALIIGAQEIVTAFAERLHITEGPIGWIGRIDPGYIGLIIVGIFLLTWIASVMIWRVGRIDERWSAHLREPAG
jgi:high-affinity nickel-transport protein